MEHEFLTYAEAAKLLGIKPDSVRRRARANHWPRRVGNDGLAMVGIPRGLLPDCPPGEPPGPPPGHPPDAEIAALRVEVRMLREQATDLREDRDRWRDQAERLASESRLSFLARIFRR